MGAVSCICVVCVPQRAPSRSRWFVLDLGPTLDRSGGSGGGREAVCGAYVVSRPRTEPEGVRHSASASSVSCYHFESVLSVSTPPNTMPHAYTTSLYASATPPDVDPKYRLERIGEPRLNTVPIVDRFDQLTTSPRPD